MSIKDKLKERFLTFPSDFTFDELIRFLRALGYQLGNKGNTSGSRVSFEKDNDKLYMHKPHPGNIVKVGVLKCLYRLLKQRGLL